MKLASVASLPLREESSEATQIRGPRHGHDVTDFRLARTSARLTEIREAAMGNHDYMIRRRSELGQVFSPWE